MLKREEIVKVTASQLGFPGGRQVYALLKTRYHWYRMLLDCLHICVSLVAVQLEEAKFCPLHCLLPMAKDLKLLVVRCIDLIVKFWPKGPNGE